MTKKHKSNISVEDILGKDDEGNEITILDILKTPDPDFASDIHKEDNINNLKIYLNVLTSREKEIIYKFNWLQI